CWVTANSAFITIDEQPGTTIAENLAPATETTTPTMLEPNGVYWIFIEGNNSVTLSYKPPVRDVEGDLE
ncbi:MAG: hypothetical protein AAF614_43330, partial [Chloroflexota bacterium]